MRAGFFITLATTFFISSSFAAPVETEGVYESVFKNSPLDSRFLLGTTSVLLTKRQTSTTPADPPTLDQPPIIAKSPSAYYADGAGANNSFAKNTEMFKNIIEALLPVLGPERVVSLANQTAFGLLSPGNQNATSGLQTPITKRKNTINEYSDFNQEIKVDKNGFAFSRGSRTNEYNVETD
ncbi:hypothetical protein BY458DRAFT_547389 [Sporodiniella umbellata]|nr:hypothetical protein BY458DRAFT_547389 [Sporodiniella umbellata]